MNKQRTHQQASRDSKEAREAWERGEKIEIKVDYPCYGLQRDWCTVDESDHVSFSDPGCYWRVAKPAAQPLVIGPGKYRMRNGEVRTVEQWGDSAAWLSKDMDLCWFSNGNHCENKESPYDLISRVETKWRPWRPEEVPLGAMICRCDDRTRRGIITNNDFSTQELFASHERIHPDGSFLAPCGVEEVVG